MWKGQAIHESDLGAALAMVRQWLGIEGEGTAHIWLDCIAETQWDDNAGSDREALLQDYIAHERARRRNAQGSCGRTILGIYTNTTTSTT